MPLVLQVQGGMFLYCGSQSIFKVGCKQKEYSAKTFSPMKFIINENKAGKTDK